MRIALVCGNYQPDQFGGSMVSSAALAARLSQKCHVDVLCGYTQRETANLAYKVRQLGRFPYLSFHPETTNFRERYTAAMKLRKYYSTCTQYLKNWDYAIVNAQGPWCEVASIVTVRFVYPEYLRVLSAHGYATNTNDPWSNMILELERRTYLAPTVKHFIAVSKKARCELQTHYNIPSESITVINNGVDTQRFSLSMRAKLRAEMRKKLGVDDSEILIVYCGNNFVRKNLALFLRIVRRFHSSGVKLAMLANNRPETEIIGQEDRKNIAYFGMTKSPERVLAASDILLFPTLYDTCAKIVLEAMALGVAVVVSQASGLANIIRNGRNGWIVDSTTDIRAYEEILRELIQNAELRYQVGKLATLDVASKLSWDQVTEKVLDVYLRTHKPGPS